MSPETVGRRIRAARDLRGFSQRGLATRLGLDQSQLSKYERGYGMPSFFNAICIADALGVSLDYIAGRIDEPNAN